MAESVATAWRNRIVRYGEEAPDQLLAHPRNFRIHPKAQQDALTGALNDLGWIAPVLVNETTGHVIDGHLRIGLAISRGVPTIPVAYVALDEAEEAEALLTLDPIAAMAVADTGNLALLLEEVKSGEAGVQAMLAELAKENGLYAPPTVEAPEAQIDRAEELRVKWGVETGQLWEIGRHRLLCGDATKAEDVARLMAGHRADCMWTDPPYGVEYVGKTKAALTIDNDSSDGLDELLTAAFRLATTALIPCAPVYTAHPAGALCLRTGLAYERVGWRIHQDLVWVKDSMVLGHSDYHWKHEPILHGYTPGDGRPGRGDHPGTHWYGDHSQTSVFEVPRPKRSEDHPTMKPPALVAAMLANSCPDGGSVYDPFLGSGTTACAAESLGRTCYACDLEPQYVAVSLQRLADMGLTPRLVE